ncbi:MAG TPA: DUF2304 domain-containing protein [Anaeromyxobacter sp.]|nr:DUF2304 domain-containing protein [Anaeromyxobacter sp.]
MTPTQRTFAIFTSVATLLLVLELVRRRRLKEEYSWLWIVTSAGMLLLSGWYGLIEWVSRAIGAVTVTTTLFLFGLLFLLAISVHYSIVLSRLTQQVRRLTQELAIVSADRELEPAPRGQAGRPDPSAPS